MKKELLAGLLAAIVLVVGAVGLFFVPELMFSPTEQGETNIAPRIVRGIWPLPWPLPIPPPIDICWVIPKGPWTTVWECKRDIQAATDACGKCCTRVFRGDQHHICSQSCGTIHIELTKKCKLIRVPAN